MDDDLLDEILDEVEALGNQLPGETLALLFEERARGIAPGAPGRAAWLSHAGERWEMEGELERARTCFEQAAQDGGEAYLDPRAAMLNVLLELGETARVDDLLADLRRDLKAGWDGRFVHEMVGEALELHGRLDEAQRWFTSGLTHAERLDPEAVDLGCLNGRWRVRRALDLPHDRYDDLCEERRREYAADIEDEKRLLEAPAGDVAPPLAVLYWPAEELELVLQRWPALAEVYGADHAEHRARVEHRLRELAEREGPVAVGIGSLEDYLRFATGRGDHVEDPSTRGMYGAHLAYTGSYVVWPPRRNDRCWCGSGLKYKKCCGALR
jgi:hypothetical protein